MEIKLTELGLLTDPGFKIIFVLDKTAMFKVPRPPGIDGFEEEEVGGGKKEEGDKEHSVKPLQIIWRKFAGVYGPHNTVHIDDLKRNFMLNPECGVEVEGYYRRGKKGRKRRRRRTE